jgi:hypothetical protein
MGRLEDMRELSPAEREQLDALVRHYPYRIIWCAINLEGEFMAGADHNRRQVNRMRRLGYQVSVAERAGG